LEPSETDLEPVGLKCLNYKEHPATKGEGSKIAEL